MALATPKSITFGMGLVPSCRVTRMLEGLRSRWMTPFWWACWMAWQICMNRLEALGRGEMVLVAVLRDANAADQFHHEEGPPGFGRSRIENLRDVGVVHQGEGLPLGLEAGHDLLGVHARP